MQTQRLPDLESARTGGVGCAQAPRLGFAEVWIDRDSGKVDPGKDHEAVRIRFDIPIELALQLVPPLAVEIDHQLDPAFIHRLDQLGNRTGRPVAAERTEGGAQMVMRVDDRKFWTLGSRVGET